MHDVNRLRLVGYRDPRSLCENCLRPDAGCRETVFFHELSSGCDRSRYEGYVAVESGADLSGASLRNCIVLAGCDAGSRDLSDAIVYPGGVVQLNLTNFFGSPDAGMIEIGAGGSDRRYFRVEHAGNRTVLMQCLDRDEEFERQAAYTRFFSAQGGARAASALGCEGSAGHAV